MESAGGRNAEASGSSFEEIGAGELGEGEAAGRGTRNVGRVGKHCGGDGEGEACFTWLGNGGFGGENAFDLSGGGAGKAPGEAESQNAGSANGAAESRALRSLRFFLDLSQSASSANGAADGMTHVADKQQRASAAGLRRFCFAFLTK